MKWSLYLILIKQGIVFLFCCTLFSYSFAMNNSLTNNLTELTSLLNDLNSSLAHQFFIGFDSYSLLKDLVGSQQVEQWKQEGKLISNVFLIFSIKSMVKKPQSIVDDIITNLKKQNTSVPTAVKIDYTTTIISPEEKILRLHILYFIDQNKNPMLTANASIFLMKFFTLLKQHVTITKQQSSSYLSSLLDIAILKNPTPADEKILKEAINRNRDKMFTIQPRVEIWK